MLTHQAAGFLFAMSLLLLLRLPASVVDHDLTTANRALTMSCHPRALLLLV